MQLFGHCVGSSTILMALGAGMTGVRSAVCSQFSLHPHTSLLNHLKCTLRVGQLAHALHVRGLVPDDERNWTNVAADVALRLVPMPRGEACGRPICRFINAVYGCTHTHAALDEPTHRSLDDAFGYGNTRTLEHLALIMRRRLTVDAEGRRRLPPGPRSPGPAHPLPRRRPQLHLQAERHRGDAGVAPLPQRPRPVHLLRTWPTTRISTASSGATRPATSTRRCWPTSTRRTPHPA